MVPNVLYFQEKEMLCCQCRATPWKLGKSAELFKILWTMQSHNPLKKQTIGTMLDGQYLAYECLTHFKSLVSFSLYFVGNEAKGRISKRVFLLLKHSF